MFKLKNLYLLGFFLLGFILFVCSCNNQQNGYTGGQAGGVKSTITATEMIHYEDSTTVTTTITETTEISHIMDVEGDFVTENVYPPPGNYSFETILDPDSSWVNFAFIGDGYGWPEDTAYVLSNMGGTITGTSIGDPEVTMSYTLYGYSHDPFAYDPVHGYAYLDSFTLVPAYPDADSVFLDYTAGILYCKSKFLLVTDQIKYGDSTYLEFELELTANFEITPTAAEMASFTAESFGDYVAVSWMTSTEIGNAGFNIHRSLDDNGSYTKINDKLITARGSELEGAAYNFTDGDIVGGLTYYYWLESIDLEGASTMHGPVLASQAPEDEDVPTVFNLAQNYPNPFNPITEIMYNLPVDCHVSLVVYNVLGQKVVALVNEYQQKGNKVIQWDGRGDNGLNAASGIYFYKLQAGSFTEIKKMSLLR